MTQLTPRMEQQNAPNPYVGPRPFTTDERDRFFGREQEASQLIPLTIAEHLVLFYAQSGAGKSSLINARLVPGLAERNFKVLTGRVSGQSTEGVEADNIFIFNLLLSLERSEHGPAGLPGAESLVHTSLADYLANLDIEPSALKPPALEPPRLIADSAAAKSAGDGGGTQKLLIDAPQTIGGVQPLALIIDQFEEIFTTNPGAWNQRGPFFQQIRDAMLADPYLWVVLAIREDYIASLDPFAGLLPGKLRARFHMQRMAYDAALDAVCLPVKELRPFEPDATEELVRNLSLIAVGKDKDNNPIYQQGQFIEPVQLQVVCYQLWEELRNRPGKNITREDLLGLARGKDLAQFISTALANYYEQSLHEVMKLYPRIRERKLREWFSQELITETETRSSVRQGKLSTGSPPNDLPNQMVKTLQDRFIIRAEIRGDNTWYELSHDRFVGPILQSNREWFNQNSRPVEVAAQARFDTGQDDPGKLYDGRQLQGALELLQKQPDDLSDRAKKFIEASQAAADKRQKQRQRLLIAFFSLLVVVLTALTAFSFTQSRIARTNASLANIQRVTANVASTQAIEQRSTAVEASVLESEQRHRAETASALEASLRQAAESARATAEVAKGQAEVASTQAVEDRDAARNAELVAQQALTLAQGARLSSLSDYFRNNKLDLSLLLAIQSVETSGGWQSQRALLDGVQSGLETRVSPVGFPWRVRSSPYSVAFNPAGTQLAVAGVGHVDLWNVTGQGRPPQIPSGYESESTMYSVSFDTTGSFLARAGGDGDVRIWDLAAGKVSVFRPFGYVYSAVLSVAFQPNGDLLAVGTDRDPVSGKGLLYLYNYKSGQVASTGDCDIYACSVLAWSSDGSKLAVGSQGGAIQVLEAARLTPLMEIDRAHTGEITGLAWYPDGQRLVSGGVDQRLVQWDTTARKILSQTNNKNTPIVISLALSPDGRFLLAGVNDKDTWFGLWDAETLQKMNYRLSGHTAPVSSVAFNPQGNLFVTAGYDNAIILWKFEPVESLSRSLFTVNGGRVDGLLQNTDGKLIFARSVGTSHLETIMEGTDKPVSQKVAHTSLDMASLSGQPVVALGRADGQVILFDPAAGVPVGGALKISSGSIRSLTTSRDGKLLAAAFCLSQSCSHLAIWDLPAAQPLALKGDLSSASFGTITSLAFSPNVQTLAIGNSAGKIFIYDIASGKLDPVVTEGLGLRNVSVVVTSLAFSPEQNVLAAGFQDGRIALWEASSRNPIGEFIERANGEVTGLLFRKNTGEPFWYLVSTSSQGEVREWSVDVNAWIARACQMAGRNLTAEEKAKFLLPGDPQAYACPPKK